MIFQFVSLALRGCIVVVRIAICFYHQEGLLGRSMYKKKIHMSTVIPCISEFFGSHQRGIFYNLSQRDMAEYFEV